MYNYIINPTSYKKIKITSNLGKNILKNYLKQLGGASTGQEKICEFNKIDKITKNLNTTSDFDITPTKTVIKSEIYKPPKSLAVRFVIMENKEKIALQKIRTNKIINEFNKLDKITKQNLNIPDVDSTGTRTVSHLLDDDLKEFNNNDFNWLQFEKLMKSKNIDKTSFLLTSKFNVILDLFLTLNNLNLQNFVIGDLQNSNIMVKLNKRGFLKYLQYIDILDWGYNISSEKNIPLKTINIHSISPKELLLSYIKNKLIKKVVILNDDVIKKLQITKKNVFNLYDKYDDLYGFSFLALDLLNCRELIKTLRNIRSKYFGKYEMKGGASITVYPKHIIYKNYIYCRNKKLGFGNFAVLIKYNLIGSNNLKNIQNCSDIIEMSDEIPAFEDTAIGKLVQNLSTIKKELKEKEVETELKEKETEKRSIKSIKSKSLNLKNKKNKDIFISLKKIESRKSLNNFWVYKEPTEYFGKNSSVKINITNDLINQFTHNNKIFKYNKSKKIMDLYTNEIHETFENFKKEYIKKLKKRKNIKYINFMFNFIKALMLNNKDNIIFNYYHLRKKFQNIIFKKAFFKKIKSIYI